MVDPKLNELPIDPEDEIVNAENVNSAEAGTGGRGKRRGLSINDTVAANANLSVGARGVDTSGVRAGAGAGAGMTTVTAGEAGESPVPQIVGGDRGSGTTVLGANDSETTGSTVPAGNDVADFAGSEGEISARAYQYWCDRGCPEGSSEVDWHRAVEEHRLAKGHLTRSATV